MARNSTTAEEILESCANLSPERRQQIVEEFVDDIKTLSERMSDLFDCDPGVLMLYGVTVEVKVKVFDEDTFSMKLGNEHFYHKMSAMIKEFKKNFHKDDEDDKTA